MRLRFMLFALAALVGLVLVETRDARPALAAHHSAEISELMSGFDGDADVQFVEVKLIGAGQTAVANTRLTVFNPNGSFNTVLLNPLGSNIANSTQFVMGTAAFQAASGITPDFTMPTGILPAAGMVCWGAPDVFAPDPGTWSASDPNNYVDCVSYGGASFTGVNPMSPSPNANGAGNGALSLTRIVASTGKADNPWRNSNDDTDFALQSPSPTNNAGQVGSLAAVGGVASSPDLETAPLAAEGGGGPGVGAIAAIAGGATAAAVIFVTAGAWYARRRRTAHVSWLDE